MSATPFDPDATTGPEQPTPPPSPPDPPHPRVPFGEKPGEFIGPCKLLELIGEGGYVIAPLVGVSPSLRRLVLQPLPRSPMPCLL